MQKENKEAGLEVGVDNFLPNSESNSLVESHGIDEYQNMNGTGLAKEGNQLLDAPADVVINARAELTNDIMLQRASPMSGLFISAYSESESDTEMKNIIDSQSVHEGEYETDFSDDSYAIELDSGDSEVTFNRQTNVKTSSKAVKNDNLVFEPEYLIACMKGLAKQLNDIQTQNKEMKEIFIGKVEKTEMSMTVNTHNMQVNVKEAISQLQSLKKEMTNSAEIIQNDIQKVKGDISVFKNDIVKNNAVLKNEITADIGVFKNDIVKNNAVLKNEITADISVFKNDIVKNNAILKNEITADIGVFKSDIDRAQTALAGQIVSLTTVSTDTRSAITGMEGRVETVGQKLDNFRQEVETLQLIINQMQSDVQEEVETRKNEKIEIYKRIQSIEEQLGENKVDLLATSANQDIQVMALKASLPTLIQNNVAPLEKQIQTLIESISEIKNIQGQQEIKCRELEGAVEATTAQGNELNNQIHLIGGEIKKVGTVIPELIQTSLFQAVSQWQGESNTLNFKPPVSPRVDYAPLPFANLNNNQVPPPQNNVLPPNTELNVIPSISSSPRLPESFTTPSPFQLKTAPPGVSAIAPKARTSRSDSVIADMVKRNQKPSFSGDNISPPMFLREVEVFFDLIQVTEDRDKLQVFPTLLLGNPFEWWKIISNQVTSWEMAKSLLLKQYFNEYEKQRYKSEWRNLDFRTFNNVEEFTLRGLQILNTIKPRDTDQKRCERITIKLPEPLRDYLLNRHFTSTQDFLKQIKDAMLLKNFDSNQYFKNQNQIKSNNSYGNNYSNGVLNSNLNNGGNNQTVNNNNNGNKNDNNNNSSFNNANHNKNSPNNGNKGINPYLGMNPNFRGNPRNYDPNYKQNQANRTSYGGPSSGNYYNSTQRTPPSGSNQSSNRNSGNGNRLNGYSRGRGTYYNGNNGNQNQQNGNVYGVAQNRQAPGVNQVGWALPSSSLPPLALMPPSSPVGTPPPSPPVTNNFNFNFTPEMCKGLAKAMELKPPPQPTATLQEADEDTATNRNPVN